MFPICSKYFFLVCHRSETCYQIAVAIKHEVEDLEAAGISVKFSSFAVFLMKCQVLFFKYELPCLQVIQIDEAALREGLPLRKSEQAEYLNWAVHSFRITNCGLKDTTQVKGSLFTIIFSLFLYW